ncbi:MAG: DUF502 domain-containing protein [Brevinematales bacterium]|nr:DUF502 domain-containing protein [Brevinematales bacterium]
MKTFMKNLRKSFIEGLIFIIPISIMLWIIYYVFKLFYGMFHFAIYFIPLEIRQLPYIKITVTIIAFLIVLLLIIIIGFLVNSFFGRLIRSLFDKIFSIVPIFKTFYDSLKQLSSMIFKEKKAEFSSVVLIEFPKPGSYSVGFITSKVDKKIISEDGKEYISVFIPTSPNPTTGFTIITEKDKVKKINISVEEALKFVVFVGSLQENGEK